MFRRTLSIFRRALSIVRRALSRVRGRSRSSKLLAEEWKPPAEAWNLLAGLLNLLAEPWKPPAEHRKALAGLSKVLAEAWKALAEAGAPVGYARCPEQCYDPPTERPVSTSDEGWGAKLDAWTWPVAVPVGMAAGGAVGGAALWVGGVWGVVFGAIAAAAFGWLVRQGETRVVVKEPTWWERWRERKVVEAPPVQDAPPVVEPPLVMEEAPALEENQAPEVEPEVANVRSPPLEPDPAVPDDVTGVLVNETDSVLLLDSAAGFLVGPRLDPFNLLKVDEATLRTTAKAIARWQTQGMLTWYGPDIPGVLASGLSPQELEDGPPRVGGLFEWGRPMRRLNLLAPDRRPNRVLDYLGPMMDLPAGRLTSESWPDGVDVDPLRVMLVPVTEALWQRVMGEQRGHWKFGQAPVTNVSWFDAIEFCNRASELSGYAAAYDERRRAIPEADGFRLPTDAEWEYACRAGKSTRFFWGDDEASAGEYAWFNNNSSGRAHAVGRKLPNAWGLYDTAGNVFEWCESVYKDGTVVDNPPAMSTPKEEGSRVLRGGPFDDKTGDLRASNRLRNEPSNVLRVIGFRCVRGVRRQLGIVP